VNRILLLGKDGQVGWELQRVLAPHFHVLAPGRGEVDLSEASEIRSIVRSARPDTIINAAAYTAVDRAEQDEASALSVNGTAVEIMATEARALGALLVHYSTDYVFDGAKAGAYVETDRVHPLGAYGRTKRAGEEAIESSGCHFLIFRTSWIYGARGTNFLLTMLRLANRDPALRVVNDQHGVPNWSRMVAQVTLAVLLERRNRAGEPLGIYHLSACGAATWHSFAEAIVALGSELGLARRIPVLPVSTTEYPTATRRPANSVLSSAKLQNTFNLMIPDWHACLRWCMEDLAAAYQAGQLAAAPRVGLR
jgi:dTDP-4-dehydrorhamnose reductase